ncbi:hypothetical protein DQ04_09131030 [Trypanosoma grayi]|uniref:hypothetical protein n=1 Tax=Trypanosoma grayi TaxID=71804 RepID=UPI0004F4A3BF|nr:hypothetical protein DQ04_09131030 [Trypanosoma grayi]KEG07674.1 hypothetical protein DQ04_09131030 [Trypanosoma grayi]
MMDVGVAGYITPEDMKEFFMCVDGVSASPCSDFLRLGKDELCNCDRFVALTLAALRSSSRGSRTLGEWVDHYWLLQYRKIFMGTAALMNWDAELTTIPPEPTHGFDSFELATLLFALTEAGLRLVNAVEVEQWVRSGQHRRGCAITMEQLATLLDTLSKAVPFSETWLALLQHRSSSKQKVLEIINTYSAVADATVVEELREHIMQLKRDTMAGGRCANCSRLEEVLQQQAVRLADMEAARESSEVNLGHLERRFEERAEAFAQLQQDYWHVQMLLEDAQLHEVELAEALENAKGQLPMHPRGGGTLALNTFAAAPPGAVAGDGVPSLLQLMPCGRLAQHMRDSMPIADSPILSTIGAVAYAIPPELSQPSEWCVDVFWCDATRDGRNKIERLVCRDSDGRRSCAFLLKNSELQVVVADYNNSSSSSCGGGGHSFRLTPRRWYRLHCALDWRAKMFDVTVTEVGHGGSAAAALKSTKMTATRASWGPIAMIDAQTSGIAVVDIFPRTELLMSYCNFFLRYTS